MTDPPLPTYQDLRFRDLENRAAGGRTFWGIQSCSKGGGGRFKRGSLLRSSIGPPQARKNKGVHGL